MDRREPIDRPNDPGTNKRAHTNEDAPRTTDYIQINQANQQRPNQQRSNNDQGSGNNQNAETNFQNGQDPLLNAPNVTQYLLPYSEVRKQMSKQDSKMSYKIHKGTGIGLYFPYKDLNRSQNTFIGKVFEALNKKKHLIIESPTGTGKTLSLLAGTLSWMEYARRTHDSVTKENPNVVHQIQNLQQVTWTHVLYTSKTHFQLGQIQKQLQKLLYRPKMSLYGSRDKLCNNRIAQWRHGINEDKTDEMKCRCNAAVKYNKYSQQQIDQQTRNIKKQIKQKIDSCQDEIKRRIISDFEKDEFDNLLYISKRYLNLDQNLMKTQEQISAYKNDILKCAKILGDIEEIKKNRHEQDINYEQNEQLRRKKQMDNEYEQKMKKDNIQILKGMKTERADMYYTNQLIKKCIQTKKFNKKQEKQFKDKVRQLWSMESKCPYFKDKFQSDDAKFYQEKLTKKGMGVPLNIEELKRLAQKFENQNYKKNEKVCTYFLPRRLDNDKDLYLMPYIYLLDQNLLPMVQRLVKNSILVFDEGHNVDKAAREGYSADLKDSLIKDALAEIRQKKQKDDKDKDVDQIQIERLQREYQFSNPWKRMTAQQIYSQLKKQDIERQKIDYLKNQRQQRNHNQNNNNEGNQNNQNQKPLPKFQCKLTNDQLRRRLSEELVELIKLISRNIHQYFSSDKKNTNGFVAATNLGADLFGWKENASLHTAKTNEIKDLIKDCFFKPQKPIFQWSLQENQDELKKILKTIIKKLKQIQNLRYAMERYYYKIKALRGFFQKLYNVLQNQSYKGKYYLHLKQKVQRPQDNPQLDQKIFKGQISLQCLTPQFAFKALQALKPRSIIITSGTLSPLDKFIEGLGLEKQNCLDPVKTQSVIPAQNVFVRKIGCDLDSQRLTINYDYFFNQAYDADNIEQIFKLLIALIKKIPHGVLIMLSSYSLSQKLENFFRKKLDPVLRAQFLEAKPFVEFQQKKTNTDQLINKFNYFAEKEKGAALFCVCRAKLSEGIDFTDELCRGVIFIGVPWLKDDLPQVAQMKQYLQNVRGDTNFKNWMLIEVSKAINQALGRVVRHQKDYGSIFLIDSRYNDTYGASNTINKNISSWITDNWQGVFNQRQLSKVLSDVSQFFTKHDIRRQEQLQNQRNNNQNNQEAGNDNESDQSLRPSFNSRIQQGTSKKSNKSNRPMSLHMKVRQSMRRDNQKNFSRINLRQRYAGNQDDQTQEVRNAIFQNIKQKEETKRITNQFDEKLKTKGFDPKKIIGDGFCLYRSFSFLHTSISNQEQYAFIKHAVIQLLDRGLNGPQYLVQKILNTSGIEGANNAQKIRNYRDKVFRRYEIGTQLELLAISYIFGVAFILHKNAKQIKDQTQEIYYPNPSYQITQQNLYHIGYYQFKNQLSNHYFALVPIKTDLSSFNLKNYADRIKKMNQQQKNFIEPQIRQNNEQFPEPMIQENIKRQQSSINYKDYQKPISQIPSDKKYYYQNGRISYSPRGTILDLSNLQKRFNIDDFFKNLWDNVQILEIRNCNIQNKEWGELTRNAEYFPNLRYINISQNKINKILRGDLQRFESLRLINFQLLSDANEQTYKYLQDLRQKYINSEDKLNSIRPLFRRK